MGINSLRGKNLCSLLIHLLYTKLHASASVVAAWLLFRVKN
jgi:hypothetical protein